MLAPLQRWLAELSISPPPPAKPSLVLEVVNVDDHLVLKVVLDSLRCRGFDVSWLGLASFPGINQGS